PTQMTPLVTTPNDVQPASGPMLSTSIPAVTQPARLQLPTQSMPDQSCGRSSAVFPDPASTFARVRRPDGSSTATTSDAITSSTSWPQNSVRQPKNWITGEPSVTPSTGPPAPTSDHQPSALTRSSRSNSSRMIAMEAVPVAAPCTPSSARAKSSRPTLGARAVSTALTMAPNNPNWYSRRWPKRSPALPKNGAATPKASSGPVEEIGRASC